MFKHLERIGNIKKGKIEGKITRDLGNRAENVDDVTNQDSHKRKRKRKFKRKFLQPQPKKKRSRKRKPNDDTGIDDSMQNETDDENADTWNGVLKNISGEEVTEVEKSLFSKGKKFCPVELDPPILRRQKELNNFFSKLEIEMAFPEQI